MQRGTKARGNYSTAKDPGGEVKGSGAGVALRPNKLSGSGFRYNDWAESVKVCLILAIEL